MFDKIWPVQKSKSKTAGIFLRALWARVDRKPLRFLPMFLGAFGTPLVVYV
jgi:hypothetical protein